MLVRGQRGFPIWPGRTVRLFVLPLAGLGFVVAGCGVREGGSSTPLSAAQAESAGRVLQVGPGKQFAAPSAAAQVARDGDIIEIAAGTYAGDVAIWRADDLVIRGVGGRAHLRAEGAHAEGKAIWVIKGRNTTVEDIEFSGARVPSKNGAGIRQEGPDLTLRRCVFRDNEMGILTGANPDSRIVIEESEFANAGVADRVRGGPIGHNVYIGTVGSFTLRASYSHHARTGHNVKSRALRNFILYNRIMDERTGSSSYAVDLSNGGLGVLIGNLIQQGQYTENPTLLSYGAEGLTNPIKELYVVHNTFVNDGPRQAQFISVRPGVTVVEITNNIFAGYGSVLAGPGTVGNNVISAAPGLVSRTAYDYRLTAGSPAIDAGNELGEAHGMALQPTHQYVHPAGTEPRPEVGRPDAGAYELLLAPAADGL